MPPVSRPPAKKCLSPYCKSFAPNSSLRGLCMPCYTQAKKLVDSNRTTWDELLRMGLVAPGEDATNPFLRAFPEVKGQELDKEIPF